MFPLPLPPFTASCSTLEELSGLDTSFSFSLSIWHCRPDLKSLTMVSALINVPLPSSENCTYGSTWSSSVTLTQSRLRKTSLRMFKCSVFIRENSLLLLPNVICWSEGWWEFWDGGVSFGLLRPWYTHGKVIFCSSLRGKNTVLCAFLSISK